MLKLLLITIHIIFFIFSQSIFGLTEQNKNVLEYVHTNFTTKDGLPSNEVYCVFQDSKGYIWIGTDRGVAKYDGYSFEIYTTENGLTDDVIFGIAEDTDNNIWLTTSNMKLCFITVNNEVKEYSKNNKLKEIIKQVYARHSYFDNISINNDTLIVSQFNFGYVKIPLNTSDIIFNRIFETNDRCSVNIIHEESQNKVYTNCIEHLLGYSNIEYNGEIIDSIFTKSTINNKRGYALKDSTYYFNEVIYTLRPDNTSSRKSVDYNLHAFQSRQDLFVNKLDDNSSIGYVYLVDSVLNESSWVKILNEKIRLTSSLKDNNGGIWLSSLENGLYYISSEYNKVITPNLNTKVIIPYGEKVLLLGRKNNGFIYDYSKITSFNDEVIMDSILGHFIGSITLSHPIHSRKITNWIDENMAFSSIELYAFWIDKEFMDIVSVSKVLSMNNKGQINEIIHDYKLNKINTILRIDSTSIIIGHNNQISIIKDGLQSSYLNEDFNYDVRDLKYMKSLNILAVSTIGSGVFLFKDGNLLRKLSIKDGLISSSINQLFFDKHNRLWIGSNKGVNYVDIFSDNQIKVHSLFASSRSLQSPNVQQLFMYNDSILLIGTDHGVNEINVKGLTSNKKRNLPIFITEFSINDSIGHVRNLEYHQNNISIGYTAVEFNRYGNIEYRYRLIGLSDQWIYTKERKAYFMGLVPGNYQFELEVRNEFGDWIVLENPPEFTINKPYWLEWWFIGCSIFLILGIIGGVLYYYITNLKKEKTFLENEQKLSDELNESQQKALSSQLNPHFVFNSLNSIQNFILTKRTELSSDYLSMFSKLMRFVFENSKKLYVPLSDEIEALSLYLELEQVRHNHKFEFSIEYDQINTNKINIPALLIQPIIENAIWHGLLHKQDDDRLLEITFSVDKALLYIEVKDNGVGREFSSTKPKPKFIKKQKSSGVELTKQRLRLLSESTGLKTEFDIIDLFDVNKESVGTKVVLSLPINLN